MSKHGFAICCCLCITLPIAILIAVGLTTNQPKAPKCDIHQFYVPALDLSLQSSTTTNTTSTLINPSLFFDIALRNGMYEYDARYDDIHLTFSYGKNIVATYVIPSFNQGHKQTSYRRALVEVRGVPWVDAFRVVSNGLKVVFRVDLKANPLLVAWGEEAMYEKHKRMSVGADVEVDGSGMKVQQGYIRMVNSSTSKSGIGISLHFILLISLFLSYNL